MSAGKLLREAVANNKPLQIVGAINAYSAIMAEKTGTFTLPITPYFTLTIFFLFYFILLFLTKQTDLIFILFVGFKALYLSGSGVAAASHGYISIPFLFIHANFDFYIIF